MPAFSARTTSDLSAADELTVAALGALDHRRISLHTPAEIGDRLGEVGESCAEDTRCLDLLWAHYPDARVAVVGSTTWIHGQVDVWVRIYARHAGAPIETLSTGLEPTGIPAFGEQVAFMVEQALASVPGAPSAGTVAILPLPEDPDADPDFDSPPPEPLPPEPPPPEPPPREPLPLEPLPPEPLPPADTEPRLAVEPDEPPVAPTSAIPILPPRAQAAYEASGESYGAWAESARLRIGDLRLEVTAAFAGGDLTRRYDVRLVADREGDALTVRSSDRYRYHAFVTGVGPAASIGLSYTPSWWLDVGVLVGIQRGGQQLTTGVEVYEGGQFVEVIDDSAEEIRTTLGLIQPAARVLLGATGAFKPYLMGGLDARIYGGYPELPRAGVTYPGTSPGVSLGLLTGIGGAIDGAGAVGGFFEIPTSLMLTPPPEVEETGMLLGVPKQNRGTGIVVALRAGVTFRLRDG